jgi:hypothetical protein
VPGRGIKETVDYFERIEMGDWKNWKKLYLMKGLRSSLEGVLVERGEERPV